MKPFRYLVFLLPLLLAACDLSPQQKADYAAVQGSGVSPAIYDKMVHDDDLGLHDIEALSRAHVNPAVILRYIRDHDTVYYLNSSDIKQLQAAGVDASIVDYMLQTARGGWWGEGPYPYPYAGWGYGPWWYGPYFGGEIVLRGGHGHHR